MDWNLWKGPPSNVCCADAGCYRVEGGGVSVEMIDQTDGWAFDWNLSMVK